MACIKRHYNFAIVFLNPAPVGKFMMCGQTVDVLTKTADFKRVKFAGFIDVKSVPETAKRVKLINISAYSYESSVLGPWIEYGRNVIMLGAYFDNAAWLLLDNGLPVAWCSINTHF